MENQIDSIHQKTLIRYLMYVEKTNNLFVNNKSRKRSSERREKKMTIEDVIKKTFFRSIWWIKSGNDCALYCIKEGY